jgi:hypothetical protein
MAQTQVREMESTEDGIKRIKEYLTSEQVRMKAQRQAAEQERKEREESMRPAPETLAKWDADARLIEYIALELEHSFSKYRLKLRPEFTGVREGASRPIIPKSPTSPIQYSGEVIAECVISPNGRKDGPHHMVFMLYYNGEVRTVYDIQTKALDTTTPFPISTATRKTYEDAFLKYVIDALSYQIRTDT